MSGRGTSKDAPYLINKILILGRQHMRFAIDGNLAAPCVIRIRVVIGTDIDTDTQLKSDDICMSSIITHAMQPLTVVSPVA